METKRTNRTKLVRGLKTMAISLLFMFLGPSLIYIAFSNSEKPLYYPLLIAGFAGAIFAVYFAFKGINRILDSLFEKD